MTATPRWPDLIEEILPFPRTVGLGFRLGVTLLLATLVVIGLRTAIEGWYLTDLKAYLAAAELLATGGNPFDVQLVERGLPYHYHYAPWFAALLIPLTALPGPVVNVAWSVVLLTGAAAAIAPLIIDRRTAAVPLALLMTFLLTNPIAEGNVQPLLLAGLVWSLDRRAGPWAIGLAASLKLTPILFVLVYAGRGEWRRVLLACAVTAALLAPTLLFEITPSALETGGTGLFTSAPAVWVVAVVLCVGTALVVARTRFAWLAASIATVVALPRLLVFDVTNLLAAFPRSPRHRAQGPAAWE